MTQPTTRVAWRKVDSKGRRQAGRLRTITRHPADPGRRFTVEVVADRTGSLRTLDTAVWSVWLDVPAGGGMGTPVARWANRPAPMFGGGDAA